MLKLQESNQHETIQHRSNIGHMYHGRFIVKSCSPQNIFRIYRYLRFGQWTALKADDHTRHEARNGAWPRVFYSFCMPDQETTAVSTFVAAFSCSM
jgi:hypothetical protein